MALIYRRPGVYIEESLLMSPADVGTSLSTACFIGAAPKGALDVDPITGNPEYVPVRVDSWSDYNNKFGGFEGGPNGEVLFLPYAVYSFFQNGGRTAYVIRATDSYGATASADVTGAAGSGPSGSTPTAFTVNAEGSGVWGDDITFTLEIQEAISSPITDVVFTIRVYVSGQLQEQFQNLSMSGKIQGARQALATINDPFIGSRFINLSNYDATTPPAAVTIETSLSGGIDPDLPDAADMQTAAQDGVGKIDGTLVVNIVGHLKKDTTSGDTVFVSGDILPSSFPDRNDLFIINDNVPPRGAMSVATYQSVVENKAAGLGSDSYMSFYSPWVAVADPARIGGTIFVPPAGSVAGVIARIDATIGVWRAPAGIIASINNAAGVETKFTDVQQGDLNAKNVNIIRAVVGAGVAIMGARTRKTYGADRYISARRTLIYVTETLRQVTQYAVFENNDQRLWQSLIMTADRVLRPVWDAGGLRGNNPAEAYYIICDDTINTPAVIQSGEVRMDIGVALEYPAEFVVIRLTQFDRGLNTATVNA